MFEAVALVCVAFMSGDREADVLSDFHARTGQLDRQLASHLLSRVLNLALVLHNRAQAGKAELLRQVAYPCVCVIYGEAWACRRVRSCAHFALQCALVQGDAARLCRCVAIAPSFALALAFAKHQATRWLHC